MKRILLLSLMTFLSGSILAAVEPDNLVNYAAYAVHATDSESFILGMNVLSSRPTIHWRLGGYVENWNHVHVKKGEETKELVNPRKYIIIEPLEELSAQIYGGDFGDFYIFGDYTLSKQAFVLTCDSDFLWSNPKSNAMSGKV